MKTFLSTVIYSVVLLPSLVFAEGELLNDDFTKSDFPQRKAQRGEWTYKDGIATCTQDDALYKKYKDHGPIIFYDLMYTDATIRFSFKPQDTKMVVFTANGDQGHVFRFVLSSTGLSVRAFPSNETVKSIALGQEKIPFPMGQWQEVEVQLRGSKATVKVGDQPAKTYEHASFARPKVNLSLGFSFGTLSVKDLMVKP